MNGKIVHIVGNRSQFIKIAEIKAILCKIYKKV